MVPGGLGPFRAMIENPVPLYWRTPPPGEFPRLHNRRVGWLNHSWVQGRGIKQTTKGHGHQVMPIALAGCVCNITLLWIQVTDHGQRILELALAFNQLATCCIEIANPLNGSIKEVS